MFEPDKAQEALEDLIREYGNTPSADQLFPDIMRFYTDERAARCDISKGADQLTYHCGPKPGGGDKWYEWRFTRRLSPRPLEDVKVVYELTLSLAYEANDLLLDFEEQEITLDHPDKIIELVQQMATSDAYLYIKTLECDQLEITFEEVE